jgi:uncharacterized small protein (DUF1192 family)
MSDDDRVAPPPPHLLGQALDDLSVAELAERIDLLRAEIVRLEAVRRSKQGALGSAEALFARPASG